MKNTVLILLTFVIGCSTQGQKMISKNDTLIDFKYLNEVLLFAHPTNYNKEIPKRSLNELIIEIENLQTDSLSISEYSNLLSSALYKFQCIHTNIVKNPLEYNQTREKSYFPLQLILFKNELFLMEKDSVSDEKITHINGIRSNKITQWVMEYRASDGGTSALSKDLFKKYSSQLISKYFDYPNSYKIQTEKKMIVKQSIPSPAEYGLINLKTQKLLSNNNNYLSIQNDIPFLKINSFSKSDKSFFKKAFNTINNYENLIIDLRDNVGGNRESGIYLAKNLIDTTFSYSILMPKLETYKYLDGKGKFNYILSKVKYNIGNASKKEKHPLGINFNYSYSPLKKIYNGNIYVISNGLTASTSTMLTSWLKQHTSTIFIGTQAGGGYNGNNGASFPTITLPNSKIQIRIPAYRLILDSNSIDFTGITPEYKPFQTKNHLNDSIDITLNYTLELITKKERWK